MKKLIWRLEERPTAMEIVELVKSEVIRADEAKNILFNASSDDDDVQETLVRALRGIYKEAGLEIPEEFYPEEEVPRLVRAIRSNTDVVMPAEPFKVFDPTTGKRYK